MKTMMIYYWDRWSGPVMSNDATNQIFYWLLDQLRFHNNQQFLRWLWKITDI